MILINTNKDKFELINSVIQKEFRLNELVEITILNQEEADIIVNEGIHVLPDWKNLQAPLLFYEEAFNPDLFLGLVYTKLGNFEKAYELLALHPRTLKIVDLLIKIQNGVALDIIVNSEYLNFDFIAQHNLAISFHYGFFTDSIRFDVLRDLYDAALKNTSHLNLNAFTLKHYAILLSDSNLLDKAEMLISERLKSKLPDSVHIELKNVLSSIWIKQIAIPYNTQLIDSIKENIWDCLQHYEFKGRMIEVGLCLYDATYIAMISNSFSEALGYITRSISIFENENVVELLAQAQLRKANLLQTWAQNNNPQFYREAVKAYQIALKIFTKENTPDIFAEIQHQLGIVYSEIPDEVKKKSVWAAISVSSFNEALSFFTKNEYPYEFAMICNSFGNAYTKYPPGAKTDNFERALEWYWAALSIRTAERYPIERVLTLSNYIEASWFAGNKTDFDEERFNDMLDKMNEILTLTDDESIIASTKLHLEKLQALKQNEALERKIPIT